MEKNKIKEKLEKYYNHNIEYYDKLEDVFKERGDNSLIFGKLNVLDIAKEANSVLDVGCGSGKAINKVKSTYPGCSCHGIDISNIGIEKAKKMSENSSLTVIYKKCDIEKTIPFSAESFDLVYCLEVIEHIVDPQTAIFNMTKMIKPGGRLLLVAPNRFLRSGWKNLLLKCPDLIWMLFSKNYINPSIIDPTLDEVGGDSDAAYQCNPWELERIIKKTGLIIERKALLKCRVLARKPR
jgi:2-polyprenyl-3-methyl-5-hydroxy-6-metoxy-1,4-benzoquinol methylase